MKNISIFITKIKIMEEVAINSAYAGAKSSREKGFFDKVATIPEDIAILSRFWTEMCGIVSRRFKEFIVTSSLDNEALSISLEVSGSFDDSLSPSVIEDIREALVAGVTSRWFRYTLPNRAPEWEEQAETLLSSAYSKLCQRRRPLRPANR